jgi:hypothetical protein
LGGTGGFVYWLGWHIKDVNDKLLSAGERTLFKGIENSNRDKGIEAFKKISMKKLIGVLKKRE